MHQELFEKLGFTQKEAEIYSALFKRGPNPVSTLSKLTGIKRTSVYDIVKNLLNKGLIISFQQGTTTYFAIDDINKLYLDQKEKVTYAEKIVAELKANPANNQGLQVTYYKGQEGYREMYEDILRFAPKELLGIMDIDNFYTGIDKKREEAWTKERFKKGIKVRLILQDSFISREMQKISPKINREIKIIPAKKFPYSSSCFIYRDHIAFFHTLKNQFTGIRIQHPQFAEMQIQAFEMAWALL